ncbi:MAG: hypothetical protein GY811_25885 [Myxococcales bacterium]|nr:hypothetical protein [Myxococcales bacterium]
MQKCENQFSCDPLDTLVGFGDKVSKDIAAIASDTGKSKEVRRIALAGLTKIKDPGVGLSLFEAAKTEEDFILRGELFKAAGAGGGDDTLEAMITHYASDASDDHRTEMRSGLRNLAGDKVFAWAVENYPSDKKLEVRFADLVTDVGEAANKEKVVELIGKSKHTMARHRLASAAVQLGDHAQISVLIEGLKGSDVYDRSDAANFLAKVAEHIPEARKQEVIDAANGAKAQDKGGLTSRGYDKLLKTLSK